MKYKIIESGFSISLIEYVNEAIKICWTPIGGVSITIDKYRVPTYCQAMVTDNMSLKLPVERKFAID